MKIMSCKMKFFTFVYYCVKVTTVLFFSIPYVYVHNNII